MVFWKVIAVEAALVASWSPTHATTSALQTGMEKVNESSQNLELQSPYGFVTLCYGLFECLKCRRGGVDLLILYYASRADFSEIPTPLLSERTQRFWTAAFYDLTKTSLEHLFPTFQISNKSKNRTVFVRQINEELPESFEEIQHNPGLKERLIYKCQDLIKNTQEPRIKSFWKSYQLVFKQKKLRKVKAVLEYLYETYNDFFECRPHFYNEEVCYEFNFKDGLLWNEYI